MISRPVPGEKAQDNFSDGNVVHPPLFEYTRKNGSGGGIAAVQAVVEAALG